MLKIIFLCSAPILVGVNPFPRRGPFGVIDQTCWSHTPHCTAHVIFLIPLPSRDAAVVAPTGTLKTVWGRNAHVFAVHMALASKWARLTHCLSVSTGSQNTALISSLAETRHVCTSLHSIDSLTYTPTQSPATHGNANCRPHRGSHCGTNLDSRSPHTRHHAISIPRPSRPSWPKHPCHYHSTSSPSWAKARKDDTPPASTAPAKVQTPEKAPDLSSFHEQLIFDDHGYAAPRPIDALPPAHPPASSSDERLSDSLLGMLSILQILPEQTRTWAARFTGYHSVDAMLQLRDDLIAGALKAPDAYCADGTPAHDLITGSVSAHHHPSHKPQLQELLIDDGLPTLARLTDGAEIALPHRVHSREVLATLLHLRAIERAAPDLIMEGYLLLQPDAPAPAAAPSMHDDEATDYRELFSVQQRAGISGTLHRVSAIEGVDGRVSGLTVRIGRHVPRAAWPLTDVLTMIQRDSKYARADAGMRAVAAAAAGKPGDSDGMPCSVLVLGGPGTGKTTVLRDFSQQLSVRFGLGRRVVIVDSSNEIGGQGRVRAATPAPPPLHGHHGRGTCFAAISAQHAVFL